MKAGAVPLLGIFADKQRLEVPLFQRRYVWSQEQQWAPLWEDISLKFREYLEGRREGPVHFLGAMVLDQKQTPSTHVVKRQVIDGQQRLTTLQVFLAALRDFAREQECEDIWSEIEAYTLNRGMMADREVEQFKVWPTRQDQPDFRAVMLAGSRKALVEAYPLTRRRYARRFDPRPRLVEAYLFFDEQLREFFIGTPDDPPLAGEVPIVTRLDEALQALKNSLHVVVIDLDADDDAQVIFETLNARGEPLLPADLLRNFVFLRAAREVSGQSGAAYQEELYAKYWGPFEEAFWREEVRQGRLTRPRSDLFMQHFLASQQAVEIPIKHLFVEYRHWIKSAHPFPSVEAELETLARFREHFRRVAAPRRDDPVGRLAEFLRRFDVGTAYPVLLHLLDANLVDAEWRRISAILESYLLRRQFCGLTTKNYNRVFLTLLVLLRKDAPTSDLIYKYFDALPGESTRWPDDDAFGQAWVGRHAYQAFSPGRLAFILTRLNEEMTDHRAERTQLIEELTIEHVMPQAWVAQWPLPSGARGLEGTEYWSAPEDDPRRSGTAARNEVVHRMGNLTLLSERLNPSVSNADWGTKRQALRKISSLAINRDLCEVEVWDEAAIERRSRRLFEVAKLLWPRTKP